jgi:hypothetical protein
MSEETILAAEQDNTGVGDEETILGEAAEEATEQAETDQPEEDKPEEKPGAPEEYADFTLPEGMEADPDLIAEFKAEAKRLNLSQEDAQKLVDIQAKLAEKQGKAVLEQHQKTVKEWADQVKQDLGADYQKELSYAAKAINKFGTPELREFFNATGIGNHPELVKVFINIGKQISEDAFVEGKDKAAPKSAAEILYGNTHKN